MDRRNFIRSTIAAGLGVTVLPCVGAVVPTKVEHVIFLFMEGGMSHIDTFDPKTDPRVKGSFNPIETVVPGIQLNQYLSGLAKRADKMAIVRSLSIKTGDHQGAQYLARTSYSQLGSIVHPHLSSWVVSQFPDPNGAFPNNITINPSSENSFSGWMDNKFAAIPIFDPARGLDNSKVTNARELADRMEILKNINKLQKNPPKVAVDYVKFYDEAIKLLNSKELDVFDLTKEPQSVRDKYGKDKFSQGCLLARRLVQAGTRFIEVNHGGWDTHSDNFKQLSEKLPVVDNAVSALMDDLQACGLLSKTLIVITTEFGRTPRTGAEGQNANGGRDHHPGCFSSLLIGGGIKGGTIYGQTDDLGEKVVEKSCSISSFNATIAHICGLDVTKEIVSGEGRPFTVGNKAAAIKEILS